MQLFGMIGVLLVVVGAAIIHLPVPRERAFAQAGLREERAGLAVALLLCGAVFCIVCLMFAANDRGIVAGGALAGVLLSIAVMRPLGELGRGPLARADVRVLDRHAHPQSGASPRKVVLERTAVVAGVELPPGTIFELGFKGDVCAFTPPADVRVHGRPVRGGTRVKIGLDGRISRYTAGAPHRFATLRGAELWCEAGDEVDATLEAWSPIRHAITIAGCELPAATKVCLDPDGTGFHALLSAAHRVYDAELPEGTEVHFYSRTWLGRELWLRLPDAMAMIPRQGEYRTPAGHHVVALRRRG